jgi:hypothetical protein
VRQENLRVTAVDHTAATLMLTLCLSCLQIFHSIYWDKNSSTTLETHLLNVLYGNSHGCGKEEMSPADVWPDVAEYIQNILRFYSKKHHICLLHHQLVVI